MLVRKKFDARKRGVHCPRVTVELKLYENVDSEYGLVCVVDLIYLAPVCPSGCAD